MDFSHLLAGYDGVFHLAAIASPVVAQQQWAWAHSVNQSASVRIFLMKLVDGKRATLALMYR
ncbi:MAG: hypothetical protein HC842_04770 [Cytophagales bacterium]|nr:hypothetical protein [Cytophagales bacterium]